MMPVSLTVQHDNSAPCLHCQAHDRHLHPKGTINCAGYKVLTSIEQYMDLISNCLPGEAEDWMGDKGRGALAATIHADHLKQWSPTFLALQTGFMYDMVCGPVVAEY